MPHLPVSPGRTLVVMPTFNEAEGLRSVVERLLDEVLHVDVLIIDDASPDGTGELADRLAGERPAVHVLHRRSKDGLGRAYLAGFAWALERRYDVVVQMDADGSHPADALPRMLELLASRPELGAVIGSRWVPGGSVVGWPRSRDILSRGGNLYARVALRLKIRDITAGYRAYPAAVLTKVASTDSDSRGYCFQIEMTLRVLDTGYQIAETPIRFIEREYGTSKMTGSIVVEAATRVAAWAVQRRLGKRFAAAEG